MLKNKEVFSIRKIKKIVAGVTLGVALVGTNALVSADETTTTTTRQESIIKTIDHGNGMVTVTEPFQTHDDNGKPIDGRIVPGETKTKPRDTYTSTVVEPKTPDLNKSIDNASQAGLEVKQGDVKQVANSDEAKSDYSKQAKTIDKTVAGYKQAQVDNKAGQEQLSNAVNRASNAGLEVKTDTKTVKSMSDTDYDKQAKTIDKAVADYKQAQVDNKAGKEQLANAVNRASNAGLGVKTDTKTVKSMSETDYDKQSKVIDKTITDYQASLVQARDLNSQLDKLMAEAKKHGFTFDVKTKTLTASSQAEGEAKGKEIQAKLKKYLADLADYQAKVKALNDSTLKKDGDLLLLGKLNTDKQGADFYKDLQVTYVGKNSSVQMVENLGWTDKTTVSDVKGLTLASFNNGTTQSNTVNGTRIVSTVTGKYILSHIKDGSSLKLKNVGMYKNGKAIDMLLTFKVDSEYKGKTDKLMPYLVMGYDLGGKVKPIAFEMMNMHYVQVGFTYLDSVTGKRVPVLDSRVISDVDFGQTSKTQFNGQSGFINPKGSQLVETSDGLVHQDDNAGTFGIVSAPAGTYVYYGIGDTVTYDHYSNRVAGGYRTIDSSAFVEFSLFGSVGKISQTLLVKPTAPRLEAVTYTVLKPTVKATTYLIEKPVVKATGYLIQKPVVDYHLNRFEVSSKPVKDVVMNGKSVDGKEVGLGKDFQYTLHGVRILGTRQNKTIAQYDFLDTLDTKHDEYKGMYHVLAKGMIKLKDGTIIKDKDDLLKYAKAYWDKKTGKVHISLKSDFLAQVADDSDFQATAILDVKRIKSGTVYNQYTNVVNGQEVVSNTVKTVTPAPPTPEEPKPVPPAPQALVQKANVLPMTGDAGSILSVVGVSLLSGLGLVGVRKRKE